MGLRSRCLLDQPRQVGAHHFVATHDADNLKRWAGRLNFVLSTVNVPLDWEAYIAALAPKGRFHNVGAVLEPISVGAFSLMFGQKSISGSPVGSSTTTAAMLDFCARHQILPVTEPFPLSRINDAFWHLREGKARYRIVLTNYLNH